eukprot:546380-Rhodomonas_salina.3
MPSLTLPSCTSSSALVPKCPTQYEASRTSKSRTQHTTAQNIAEHSTKHPTVQNIAYQHTAGIRYRSTEYNVATRPISSPSSARSSVASWHPRTHASVLQSVLSSRNSRVPAAASLCGYAQNSTDIRRMIHLGA